MRGDFGIILVVITLFVLWDLTKWGLGSGVYVRSDDQWKTTDRASGGGW